jgi:isoleucyl-tRNA synthetase
MSPSFNHEHVIDKVRQIYHADPETAESSIEQYLVDALASFSANEQIKMVEKMAEFFKTSDVDETMEAEIEDEVFSKVFLLLLGKKITYNDLSHRQTLNRLADSLNTIFNCMNQLVEVINQHLYRKYPGDETIRHVIGTEIIGEKNQEKPLETYLGQIKTAFLVAQEAFRKSVQMIMARVLDELNPENIAHESRGSFRLGPLRKAESFEIYENKFEQVKKWFNSNRFTEDFLREFEKACEKKMEEK